MSEFANNYQLPSLDLLDVVDHSTRQVTSPEELLSVQNQIIESLSEFGIVVTAGDITKGPTFTRYEVYPARGVRIGRIATYARDLAHATRAEYVNILAPIPGKDTVGIEIANSHKQMVTLRDLLESDDFQTSEAKIPLALGKGLCGKVIIADLAEMPHLLITGNSGSGKSVCLHAIITSLLYRFSPEGLRFLVIDVNGVEFLRYTTLPHLVVPVISQPNKATLALRWLANEMEKRFSIPERSPRIVVIIENFEGVMRTAKADLKTTFEHLIQYASATGIHLILTTQQANQNGFMCSPKSVTARIAFRCASRVESQSLIGEAGAEKLLGNGDLLYRPPKTSRLIRAQCALVTDAEIHRIVNFVSNQGEQCFEAVTHSVRDEEDEISEEDEELVQKCLEVMQQEGKASTSLFQRRLRLGYTRAQHILDILEQRGYVSTGDGAKPREILRAKDEDMRVTPTSHATTFASGFGFTGSLKTFVSTRKLTAPGARCRPSHAPELQTATDMREAGPPDRGSRAGRRGGA